MSKTRPRNPLALHPLLKKGKRHGKSSKARRKKMKQTLGDEIEEALLERALRKEEEEEYNEQEG